jgi:hypothetical protein
MFILEIVVVVMVVPHLKKPVGFEPVGLMHLKIKTN